MTPAKKPEVKQAVTQQATPAVAAQPQPTTPSKQDQTLTKLKAAWTERKVDLSRIETKPDGKYLNVKVGEGWPLIVIGAAGGIDLPQIKSFAKAFDAAVDGDKLLLRQKEREAKKTATTAPAKPATPASKPSEKKAETPTQRKQRTDTAIEQKLQAGA